MVEPMTYVAMASFGLAALTIAAATTLKGWQGWLEIKRLEIAGGRGGSSAYPSGDRIELADLRERVRKLEAIASCVDL